MQSFKSTIKSKSTLSLYLQQLLIEREKARTRANGININDKFYSSFRSNKYNSAKSSIKSNYKQNIFNRSARDFKSKETDIVEESDEESVESNKSQISTGFDVDKHPESSTNAINNSSEIKPSINNQKNRKSFKKLIDKDFNVDNSLKTKSWEKSIISKERNIFSKSTMSSNTSTLRKNEYHPRKNFSKKPSCSKKLAKAVRIARVIHQFKKENVPENHIEIKNHRVNFVEPKRKSKNNQSYDSITPEYNEIKKEKQIAIYQDVPKITNYKTSNENTRFIHYGRKLPYQNRRFKQQDYIDKQQFYRNQEINNRQYDYVNTNQTPPIPNQAYRPQNMMNYFMQPNYQLQQQQQQQQQNLIYNPYYQQQYQNPYYFRNY